MTKLDEWLLNAICNTFMILILLLIICAIGAVLIGAINFVCNLFKDLGKSKPFVIAEDKADEFLNEKTDEEYVMKLYSIADSFEKNATKKDDRPACCIAHGKYYSTCDTCEFS